MKEIFEKIEKKLENIDEYREKAIKKAKELIKSSTRVIILIHENKIKEAKEILEDVKIKKKELDDLVEIEPYIKEFLYEMITTAYREYVEANQFLSIIERKKLIKMEDLKVEFYPFLLGCFDAIGETKRKVLDLLVNDKLEEALALMEIIEKFYNCVSPLSYYKFVNHLRSNIDLTRKTIEDLKKLIIFKRSQPS